MLNMNLGLYLIILITIAFVISYMVGKSINYRRQKAIWSIVSNYIKGIFGTKKVGFRGLGSSGFQILVEDPIKPFRKFEVTIILMDRENILHYIIQKVLSKKDKIILKADLARAPIFTAELKDVKDVTDYSLDSELYIGRKYLLSPDAEESKSFMRRIGGKKGVLEKYIDMLSISSESPHGIISLYFTDDILEDIIDTGIYILKKMR